MKIREVAEEVARQLNVDIELGTITGSEVPIDPTELVPDWQPQVSLSAGIAQVIADAREFLSAQGFALKVDKTTTVRNRSR